MNYPYSFINLMRILLLYRIVYAHVQEWKLLSEDLFHLKLNPSSLTGIKLNGLEQNRVHILNTVKAYFYLLTQSLSPTHEPCVLYLVLRFCHGRGNNRNGNKVKFL